MLIHLFYIGYSCSGASTYTRELFPAIRRSDDIQLYVVWLDDSTYPEFSLTEEDDILYFYIPPVENPGRNLSRYSLRSLDLLSPWLENKTNIIFHLNDATQVKLGYYAKKYWQAKLIFTWHFVPPCFSCIRGKDHFPEHLQDNVLDREMINLADQIICVTRFARQIIVQYYHQKEEKTHLIYNGFSNLIHKTSDKSVRYLKKRYGFQPQEIILLYVGRLHPLKGIDILVDAFLLLEKKFPAIRLVIIGDGELRKPLERKSAGHRITFMGHLNPAEIYSFYSIANLGIIPSLYEQCSYVALEMMAHRLPIAYAGIPGLEELFEDQVNGSRIEANWSDNKIKISPETLENTILTIYTNPKYKETGHKGYLNWQQNYQNQQMGEKTLQIYRRISQTGIFQERRWKRQHFNKRSN